MFYLSFPVRLKIAKMMENEDCTETEKLNAKLSTGVYNVTDLFLRVGSRGFVPCRQDFVNIEIGNLVVFQRTGNVQLSDGVLVVGRVKSITVSPVSKKTIVFCEVYQTSEGKRFTPKGTCEMVPYDYLRVKFLNVNFDDKNQVSLEHFERFPSLAYFE